MGAPRAEIDKVLAAQKPPEAEDYLVLPENEEAVSLFLDVCTQWIVAGLGSVVGLNYQSLDFVLKMKGYRGKKKVEIFDDLQLIERGALSVFQAPKGSEKNGP